MNVLDDPKTYKLDRSGMFERIETLGDELVRAWEQSSLLELPAGNFDSIALVAMGGSAAAADYFAALAVAGPAPISVIRGYELPAWPGARSLVVIVSYSGNTEETLACYDEAFRRGAGLLVVTSGGALLERARHDNVPTQVVRYDSPPRAALAHTLAPLLRLGQRLGAVPIGDAEVRAAVRAHSDCVAATTGRHLPVASNPAKQLAAVLAGKLPMIFAAEHLAPVGLRMKNQLAENAKTVAAFEPMPEATHNMVEGLARPAGTSAVSLESPLYNDRNATRFDVLADLCADSDVPLRRISLRGESHLADMLEATAWADAVSCYLALLNGVDPTVTLNLQAVRGAMSGGVAEAGKAILTG